MMLAAVIPLPGAKSERIIQTNGVGRHPKSIALLWKYRGDRHWAEHQEQEAAKKLAAKRFELEFLEGKLIEVRRELAAMQGAGNGR